MIGGHIHSLFGVGSMREFHEQSSIQSNQNESNSTNADISKIEEMIRKTDFQRQSFSNDLTKQFVNELPDIIHESQTISDSKNKESERLKDGVNLLTSQNQHLNKSRKKSSNVVLQHLHGLQTHHKLPQLILNKENLSGRNTSILSSIEAYCSKVQKNDYFSRGLEVYHPVMIHSNENKKLCFNTLVLNCNQVLVDAISVNYFASAGPSLIATPPPRKPQTIFILLFTILIVIGIGVFLAVFGLLNESNVLSNEFELECGGALLLNTTNTNGATGVAIRTTINSSNNGVGLGLKNEFGNALRGTKATQTIATTVTSATITINENNNTFYANTPATHTINTNGIAVPAPNSAFYFNPIDKKLRGVRPAVTIAATTTAAPAPAINNKDKLDATCVGLHDFNINEYVFNVVFTENEFGNEINNVFDAYTCFNEIFGDHGHCSAYYYASADVVGRKVCSSHGAGYKIIATTPALSIASAREPDQHKTKPAERPK